MGFRGFCSRGIRFSGLGSGGFPGSRLLAWGAGYPGADVKLGGNLR